jgi:hypothetical protein
MLLSRERLGQPGKLDGGIRDGSSEDRDLARLPDVRHCSRREIPNFCILQASDVRPLRPTRAAAP